MIGALACLAGSVIAATHGHPLGCAVNFALGAALLAYEDHRAARRRAKGPAEMMTSLRCPECATATFVDDRDPDAGFDQAVRHVVDRHGYEWANAAEAVCHENGPRR